MEAFLLKLSFVVAIGAHGADLGSTMYCLGAKRCQEINPILAPFKQPAIFGGFKMGVAGGSEVLIYNQSKKHPKIAMVTNFIIGGVFTGIAVHNSKVSK